MLPQSGCACQPSQSQRKLNATKQYYSLRTCLRQIITCSNWMRPSVCVRKSTLGKLVRTRRLTSATPDHLIVTSERSENLWHRFDRLTRHGNSTKKLASPCFFAIDQFFMIFPKVRYTLLHELEHAVYSAASCSRKTDTAN